MRITYTDENAGVFDYSESFWMGKKELYYNGQQCMKAGKNQFKLTDGTLLTLKGSFLTGITISYSGKTVSLVKNKWWETLLIFLPFAYLLLGFLGGAIGGALAGIAAVLAAVFNATVLRTKQNIFVKVAACIAIFVVLFLAWFFIFSIIVGGLAVAFPSLFG